MLSSAYKKLSINTQASTSALAQEANYWDPPSKSAQGSGSAGNSGAESVENLLKWVFRGVMFWNIFDFGIF